MELTLFMQLSIIVFTALLVSFLMKLFKQPLIIGYILTGIIISPYFLGIIKMNDTILIFSQIGIAFLLFMVGLNLNPKVIKEIGKVALITGIGQIVFTSVIGYFIALALGFSSISSLYISIALTFSSTIIITKLLSDKGDLDTLYGKISIGFLIVQDIVAIFILMAISAFSSSQNFTQIASLALLKGIFLFAFLFIISFYLMPKATNLIAKSSELLFLFSIAWCFLFSFLSYYAGFSIEIGALLAGISLSMSNYSVDIISKIKPLKDFFIIIFFITLGFQMQLADFSLIILPSIIFSMFILVGNPLIVMILMGFLGYTKRNSFLSGLTVAQISEFSLILISLGIAVNHLSSKILSLVTLTGIITIAGSTYMIIYSESIYSKISNYLSIFERKTNLKDMEKLTKTYEAALFGYNRIGFAMLKSFKKINLKCLVIDFNPETISSLKKKKIESIYGDAENSEFLNELKLGKLKIAMSTIPSLETNLLIIEEIRKANKKAVIITIAHQINDAFALYNAGADYVLLPHFLGGDYVAKMIEEFKSEKKFYLAEKKRQIFSLTERMKAGHEHPKISHA